MMPKFHFFILTLIAFFIPSCSVSFINSGIDYSVLKTFSIEQFGVKAGNAPPVSGQTFSERLKDRVLSNTRLSYSEQPGDVQFSGNVTGYTITSQAPQADQTVAFQRLSIEISINFKNIQQKDGSGDWNQNFSRFANFDATQDLASVENQLIQDIYDQILDDVFNRAFSGW